jgi:hypothetical protein
MNPIGQFEEECGELRDYLLTKHDITRYNDIEEATLNNLAVELHNIDIINYELDNEDNVRFHKRPDMMINMNGEFPNDVVHSFHSYRLESNGIKIDKANNTFTIYRIANDATTHYVLEAHDLNLLSDMSPVMKVIIDDCSDDKPFMIKMTPEEVMVWHIFLFKFEWTQVDFFYYALKWGFSRDMIELRSMHVLLYRKYNYSMLEDAECYYENTGQIPYEFVKCIFIWIMNSYGDDICEFKFHDYKYLNNISNEQLRAIFVRLLLDHSVGGVGGGVGGGVADSERKIKNISKSMLILCLYNKKINGSDIIDILLGCDN